MKKLVLIFTTICFTACATMINGTRQNVSLATANGDSVIATIDGKKVQLPAENVKIKRKGELIYIYNADNPKYMDSSVYSTALNGPNNMTGNVVSLLYLVGLFVFLFPGIIAMSIDGYTGAGWQYKDTNLTVPVYFKK